MALGRRKLWKDRKNRITEKGSRGCFAPMLAKFAVAFVVLVAALAAVHWRVAKVRGKLREAQSWPTATGKILSSSFGQREDGGGFWESVRPRVEYEYTVAGRLYRSDRLIL